MLKRITCFGVLVWMLFAFKGTLHAAPLNIGETYTVEVDALSSAGAIVDLGVSTTAVADANAKITFSFSGLPTRDTYRFLLVTIKDSLGATVRQSIVPTAQSGQTTNLGVSPMTYAQTRILLDALADAGSDDPMLVLYGSILVRSGEFTNTDLIHLANIGIYAIRGPNGDNTVGGFNFFLINEPNVGAAKFASFQNAIVSRITSYTQKLKNAVEALNATDAKDARAEAADLLSQIMIDAASDADFDISYILAAMKAASDQQEEYLDNPDDGEAGGALDEDVISSMDAVNFSTYANMKAQRVKKKFTEALTELDATDTQVTRVTTALTTLANSIVTAFQAFEALFEDEEAFPDAAAIDAAFTQIRADMESAFISYIADSASTNAEIDTMLAAIAAGFGMPIGDLNAMRGASVSVFDSDLDDTITYYNGVFTFNDPSGRKLNMSTPVTAVMTWVANNFANTLTYVRDTLGVPTAMTGLDSDDDGDTGDANYQVRHDFGVNNDNGLPGDELNMPQGGASIFGLQEDINIVQHRRWAALAAAANDIPLAIYNALPPEDQIDGSDTSADSDTDDDWADGETYPNFDMQQDLAPYLIGAEVQAIENSFIDALTTLRDNIGPAGVTAAQKAALVDLLTSPDFQ